MIYFINIVYSHLANILKMLKMSFVERCNKNLTLDVIFLQVDPSAEIFADQIRGDVKLYGTEQSFETIESLVSAATCTYSWDSMQYASVRSYITSKFNEHFSSYF